MLFNLIKSWILAVTFYPSLWTIYEPLKSLKTIRKLRKFFALRKLKLDKVRNRKSTINYVNIYVLTNSTWGVSLGLRKIESKYAYQKSKSYIH